MRYKADAGFKKSSIIVLLRSKMISNQSFQHTRTRIDPKEIISNPYDTYPSTLKSKFKHTYRYGEEIIEDGYSTGGRKRLPKVKPRVLISALLQITIDTDDTTDKLKAPIVPSWNFWPSLIFALLIFLFFYLLISRFNHDLSIHQNNFTSVSESQVRKKTLRKQDRSGENEPHTEMRENRSWGKLNCSKNESR